MTKIYVKHKFIISHGLLHAMPEISDDLMSDNKS